MGHLLFLVIHIVVLVFAPVGLLLTIPLHLIYGAAASKKVDRDAPNWRTHVRCPDCKEFVRRDAVTCKHCGIALVPMDAPGFWQLPRWETGFQRNAT
jgi:hypothetical protein